MSKSLNISIVMGAVKGKVFNNETTSGTPFMRFLVHTQEEFIKADGEKGEQNGNHGVVVWGKKTELLKGLTEGDRVLAQGSLRNSSYEDSDGVKKYKTEINSTHAVIVEKASSKDDAPPPDHKDSDDVPF